MKWFSFIASFMCFLQLTLEANILGVFPSPSISHQIVYKALMEELWRRGHNVTIMTTDPDELHYNQIDVHDISYKIYNEISEKSNIVYPNNDLPVKEILIACEIMLKVIDKQLSHPQMQDLINDDNRTSFDLIFIEGIFPIAPAFKKRFDCPIILISSMGLAPNILDEFGNPLHPIIFPDMLFPSDPMQTTIWNRIYLLARHFGYKLFYYKKYVPLFNKVTEKHFGISLNSGDHIADMVFVTYNPLWHGVRPLVPAVVPIANMHIKKPKPLPNRLKQLLDNAKDGAIFFSLGTNVQSRQLSKDMLSIFVETLRELPYTVLWKWDDEKMKHKPDNVYISRWMPQLSILDHPNTKLFITQGGQQSVEESIHCGVPMLVIPLIFDQEANAFRVESHGVGKGLSMGSITKDIFKKAIVDLIQNPEYRSNVTQLRELLYDSPETSMDRAVWWTEYVLRHKGAHHLRSPAAQISLVSFLMLDVILLCFFATLLIFYTIYFIKKNTAKHRKILSAFMYIAVPVILSYSVVFLINVIL